MGGLVYIFVTFCYQECQLNAGFIGSYKQRNHETVHLQNLNCFASLRTKVIPASVSSEDTQMRDRQLYPSIQI